MRLSRSFLSLVALSAGITTAVACSDSTSVVSLEDAGAGADSSSATDAGTGTDAPSADETGTGGKDAAPGDTSTDAPVVCNTLVAAGGQAPLAVVAEDAPTPTGGTLADGTYALTAAKVYAGPGAPATVIGSAAVTLKLTGTKFETLSETGGKATTGSGTFATNGAAITLRDTCPDTKVNSGHFSVGTVDGGTTPMLTLFILANGKTVGEIFEKK